MCQHRSSTIVTRILFKHRHWILAMWRGSRCDTFPRRSWYRCRCDWTGRLRKENTPATAATPGDQSGNRSERRAGEVTPTELSSRESIHSASLPQHANIITVFDLISEHALISGHPPVFFIKKTICFFFLIFFFFFSSILIIISSDFRESNTSLLYTGLMATRALTLSVHLIGRNWKKR